MNVTTENAKVGHLCKLGSNILLRSLWFPANLEIRFLIGKSTIRIKKLITYMYFKKKLIMKNMACPKKASPYIDVTSKITRNRVSASAITIPSSAEVVRQVNTDASKNSLQNAEEEESHDVADQIETGDIYKIFKGYCSFKIKITLNN